MIVKMIRYPGKQARGSRNAPWLLLIALPMMALAAALALTRRVVVRGRSMAPGLLPGEELLCEGVTYRLRRPRRGDIVLAQGSRGAPALLVKRIAATPGDLVALADPHCWVNGVYRGENPPPINFIDLRQEALGPDEYLLLGDALNASTDSRSYGPFRRSQIKGKAWLVYRPLRAIRLLPRRSSL